MFNICAEMSCKCTVANHLVLPANFLFVLSHVKDMSYFHAACIFTPMQRLFVVMVSKMPQYLSRCFIKDTRRKIRTFHHTAADLLQRQKRSLIVCLVRKKRTRFSRLYPLHVLLILITQFTGGYTDTSRVRCEVD